MGLKDVQWAESTSVQCASNEKYSMDAVLGGRWGQRDSSVADTKGTRTYFNHCFTAYSSPEPSISPHAQHPVLLHRRGYFQLRYNAVGLCISLPNLCQFICTPVRALQ